MSSSPETKTMGAFINFCTYFGLPITFLVIVYRLLSDSKSNRIEKLKGKVVLITGASSGVGEALAHAFYAYGCKVVLAARRVNELERVKNDLLSKKVNIQAQEPIIVHLDLEQISSLDDVVQKILGQCGHIDILINNGGVSSRGRVLDTNMDVQTKLMFVNHLGPLALTKSVLPKMVERKVGHIVFVSSVQGRIALPDRSAYSASKHASQAAADSLRAEVACHNINVSVVSPGYIQTALSLNALTGTGNLHGVMDATTAAGYKPEYVADKIVNMVVSRQDELVLAPLSNKCALMLRYLAPSVYFWIMKKRASKL